MVTAYMKSPFIVGGPVCGDRFIDRAEALNQIQRLIEYSYGNILIFGNRRLGKTSFCLELVNRVKVPNSLVEYMSLPWGTELEASPTTFMQSVLLRIISRTALSLFSKKYSDLLLDLTKPQLFSGGYDRLLKLFDLARSCDRTVTRSVTKQVGAALVAKADLSEQQETRSGLGALTESEILALLEEVVELLGASKIRKFVLIIDEANKLTLAANSRLIRENLSLFSSKGLQFCFVATPQVLSSVPEAEELFHDKVEIRPFSDRASVRELTDHYLALIPIWHKPGTSFSDDAIDAIWKMSKGVPYNIQLLSSESFLRAAELGESKVTTAHVLEVLQLLLERESYACEGLWQTLTLTQRRLLTGLASEEKPTKVFSSAFLQRYGLGSASSAQRAAEALIDRGVIDRDNGSLVIADVIPFFDIWIQRMLSAT